MCICTFVISSSFPICFLYHFHWDYYSLLKSVTKDKFTFSIRSCFIKTDIERHKFHAKVYIVQIVIFPEYLRCFFFRFLQQFIIYVYTHILLLLLFFVFIFYFIFIIGAWQMVAKLKKKVIFAEFRPNC